MISNEVFISHATADDAFVHDLRVALESHRVSVWVDSRNLRGGALLDPEIQHAIRNSRHCIVVIGVATQNSPWVRKEIQFAERVASERPDYRIIPLLLPGVETEALTLWFDEEVLSVNVSLGFGGITEAMPAILAALGELLPTDRAPYKDVPATPPEDLVVELRDPRFVDDDEEQHAVATATVVYRPADQSKTREIASRRFTFTVPLGSVESEGLTWYLEDYSRWPTDLFRQRATAIEKNLPEIGKKLFQATLGVESAREVFDAWMQSPKTSERCVSVRVDSKLLDGASDEQQAVANAAATSLLAIPWELLHDGNTHLIQHETPVCVRRQFPERSAAPPSIAELPIRILAVSPRPEDVTTAYIDHRVSARPLIGALERLGELAECVVLSPATFPAMRKVLKDARQAGTPFDVVHFDGHGIYSRKYGLGTLCFEDPRDIHKLEKRRMALVTADELANVLKEHGISLVFLEACQSARAKEDPTSSIAGRLLAAGVASVVAMSHSVLVEAAQRFVKAFYAELSRGGRVGRAMLMGQQDLAVDRLRGEGIGGRPLNLSDWFVPVLFQERQDPQLFSKLPSDQIALLESRVQQLSMGALPEEPPHEFIGRSRELLALERLLLDCSWALVRGIGGIGKTAVATELARWLIRSGRFKRGAFVSIEHAGDARAILDALGRQLLPQGDKFLVAQYSTLEEALKPVERALIDHPTIIVLDNLESLLPSLDARTTASSSRTWNDVSDLLTGVLALGKQLIQAHPTTRLVLTSREALPSPFASDEQTLALGTMSRDDAVGLVSSVLAHARWAPPKGDSGETAHEITALVDAVGRHARAIVLLTREVALSGVQATTKALHGIMANLDMQHPGDRENSLYASVELSLRRLPGETRKRIRPLAVVHGGTHTLYLADLLRIDIVKESDTVYDLVRELVRVGLAQGVQSGQGIFVEFDPALPSYLRRSIPASEFDEYRRHWNFVVLMAVLELQQAVQSEYAADVNRRIMRELPNIIASLRDSEGDELPSLRILVASFLEDVCTWVGRTDVVAFAREVRESAADTVKDWSHARYLAEEAHVDSLLNQHKPSAVSAAENLVSICEESDEDAFAEAPYDLAKAYHRLGWAYGLVNNVDAGLIALDNALSRFRILSSQGDSDASGSIVSVLIEKVNLLESAGRLGEATTHAEQALDLAVSLKQGRDITIAKQQLGRLLYAQDRPQESLTFLYEALDGFQEMNEWDALTSTWSYIGACYRDAGEYDRAEDAFRNALTISVRQKLVRAEADCLRGLAGLYGSWGRTEDEIACFLTAADRFSDLDDEYSEAQMRFSAALALFALRQFDEARIQLNQTIEIFSDVPEASERLVAACGMLCEIETKSGTTEDQSRAYELARSAYKKKRQSSSDMPNGRESVLVPGQCYVWQVDEAIQAPRRRKLASLSMQLKTMLQENGVPPQLKVLASKLIKVLDGERNPELARDQNLHYQDAVELELMLENFQNREGKQENG